MWPKSILNEPNNKSLDGGRGDKNASEKQEKFDFSEPFKISNKQQLSPLKANTSGMTRSLFGQLNYPIVVSPGGDMMFKFEKPPVRLNGILHRAANSIVHDDTYISSQSTLTESSPSQSDSQIIFAEPINVVSTSFRRSSSPNKQLQSRDSSSNSILAALKSLGTKSNTKFSSIFIKPKTAKHIEQSAFYTKKEKDEMNVDDEKTSKNRKSSRLTFDNNKILGILPEEPKEIRLNESVEELLKRFSYEDSLFKMSQDQTTRSRPHLFTTSGAVVFSSSPSHQVTHLFNYRAKSKVKNVNNNDTIDWLLTNGQQSDKKSSSGSAITGSQFGLKWTCLVCLSKHLNYVNVCSICGSSKPDESISRNTTTPFATTSLPLSSTIQLAKSRYSNLNQSKSMLLKNHQQFSAYLLNRLGYSGLNFEQQHQQTTDIPTTVSASTSFSTSVETNDKKITNPYLKKWTCRYCNFSNDSLKIVCLNCRWVKTCTTERSSNDSNLSKLIIARSSGDEFKHFQSSKKATEEVTQTETTPKLDEEICCATCKTPIRETSKAEITIVKTVIGDKEKVVEKTKESDKLEADKGQAKERPLSEIFNAGGGKKWKCTTCLVMNADTLDKCSCCATSRPDLSTSSESSTVSVTVPTDKSKAFSLETTNNNTKPFLNPFQSSQLPSQTFSPSITQKPNDPTTKTTTESPLAGIFNNQNKWKCNTCLIMNDNDKIKCVACQTEKPDSNSKASKTTAAGFSLFTQTPLFPSSSVSSEGLTKKTTNDTVAPQSTPNITLPLPTPSTISTAAISSTSLPSATPSLGLPTSTTGFKIDFSTAFSNKDSSFKLPLPASATPSASTQATITPFNLGQTPSLGGSSFFGGFKAASSTTTNTTTASATPSFTLPSSINSGFSFNTTNQQNTNANSSAPAQVTFGFNPSNTTASLFGTTTATTSSRQPKDSQATTLSTTSAISTPNQLAPTISFGSMSTPTTTINTSTLGATSTILDKPSTEFNFQAGVNLLHANKRLNMDPIPNFSSNKTPNTNIGGTTFPSFNLSTSTPTSFMINTSPQTSAATLSNVPSGSFPSLLNPNSNSATTSFSTTTPTPISLFNSGSTFLSPPSTGSQSLSNNMFSNTGLTQQPKFNFSSTGFSMTPHINFTSTESPFKFSASNETHSTPATEVRKIRRATRRK